MSESRVKLESLVDGLRREGWDLSRPRYVSHQVVLPTEADAEGLAADLNEAGYVVDTFFYDADYDRWELIAREGEMIVTVDAIVEAQARVEPLILARHGRPDGIGVTTRDEER